MTQKPNDPPFTLPHISQFIKAHLGDSFSRPIERSLAELIEAVISQHQPCFVAFIQWTDEYGDRLQEPVIWNYGKWRESIENRLRLKAWSDKQRIERFIREANIKLIKHACKTFFEMEEDWALSMAIRMEKEKNKGKLKMIGITKLIEKEDEL